MKPFPPSSRRPPRKAFTLVELMVSIAIFSAILVCVVSTINQTSAMWRSTSDKIEAFQDARAAFDLLTRNLSQATLNTYIGYDDDAAPQRYLRKSELQFISKPAGVDFPGTVGTGQALFFQAPASRTNNSGSYGGLEGLLNGCGYYIEYNSDESEQPEFIKTTAASHQPLHRFRLMQLVIPAEENKIYPDAATGRAWYEDHTATAHAIASNIVALIIRPQDPSGGVSSDLTDDYIYDSTEGSDSSTQPVTANQLPPVIQVTMIAITESSAGRLVNGTTPPSAITEILQNRFTHPANYDSDLAAVETAFSSAKPRIEYRVFSGAVPIRESRWSK